jgi:hypothetical protein
MPFANTAFGFWTEAIAFYGPELGPRKLLCGPPNTPNGRVQLFRRAF